MYLSYLRFEAFVSWIVLSTIAQVIARYDADLAMKLEIQSFGQWEIFQDPSIIPPDAIIRLKRTHTVMFGFYILILLARF